MAAPVGARARDRGGPGDERRRFARWVLGRGGAIVDGLTGGRAGAAAPDACHSPARAAARAMGAVGTVLMEMGGVMVGAVGGYRDGDAAAAAGVTSAGHR